MSLPKNSALFMIMLLAAVILTKLPFILDRTIPFSFDHGKDSLAVLKMVVTYKPALIGPWTSIPGLFFGPGWFYLLLPAYVTFSLDPIGGVITMIVISCCIVAIAYRYFGWLEAIIFATAYTWFSIAQSAWNPFPIALTSIGILASIKHSTSTRQLSGGAAAIIGLAAALGFHFSTAFAIFYLPIIAVELWLAKIKIALRSLITGLVAFALPFIPQVIFEIKNDFLETRAVLTYIQSPKSDPVSIDKLRRVVQATMGEIELAALPTWVGSPMATSVLRACVVALLCYAIVLIARQGKIADMKALLTRGAIWVIFPILGFTLLHYNVWYLLGLLPMVVVILGSVAQVLPLRLRQVIAACFALGLFSRVTFYYSEDRQLLRQNSAMLTAKEAALSYIRERANGQPFASYQYQGDIYDYAYQYLYFQQGLRGDALPTEFSYQPGEMSYVKEKPELLAALAQRGVSHQEKPRLIFYIVEGGPSDDLERWWGRQAFDRIIDQQIIAQNLTVYTALPSGE